MKKNPLLGALCFALCLSALTSCQKTNTTVTEPPPPVVNAGPDQTVQLPADSVWLSGSATASSRIVGYIWSEISGPNAAVFADDGSKSTLAGGLTIGTYIFQLMAVDSVGLTGVDTISVIVKPIAVDTIYLGSTGEETFLSDSTVYPYGDPVNPELLASAWTVGGVPVTGRSLFRFDLPTGLEAGLPVRAAKLTLYSDTIPLNGNLVDANYGSNNDFYIERISSTWDPNSTNWFDLPALDTTGRVYIPQTNQNFLNLVNIDVTTMVNSMISSGNNYGFEMLLKTEVIYNSRIFCSSDYPDQARRPRLILYY